MESEIKIVIYIVTLMALSGCYPIYKTLQPNASIKVVDKNSEPILQASVFLISSAYPYGYERTRVKRTTNQNGIARFKSNSEWRTEALVIHGAEVYFWNWCVVKENYQTFYTYLDSSNDFNQQESITLQEGLSAPCPTELIDEQS